MHRVRESSCSPVSTSWLFNSKPVLAKLESMTTLITLACMLLLAAAVAHYGPKEGGTGVFRLEQFRIGAPLGGIFIDQPTSPEDPDWPGSDDQRAGGGSS
ncbi:hypothetical protein GO592_21965 [Rhodococcus sp. 21391]|nr:hypothetical protein GO592_21965 [Rhodococcus sp. 21391]